MPKTITIEIHSPQKATITHEGITFDVRAVPFGCEIDTHSAPETPFKLFAESIYEKIHKLADSMRSHGLTDVLDKEVAEELEMDFEF